MRRRQRRTARPVDTATHLLFEGSPPGRPMDEPADPAASLAASIAQPAATRIVLDFNTDGYVIRGTLDTRPGPWPLAPVGAVEILTPPETVIET